MLENFQLKFTKNFKNYKSPAPRNDCSIYLHRTSRHSATFSTVKVLTELQEFGVVFINRIPKSGFFNPLFR